MTSDDWDDYGRLGSTWMNRDDWDGSGRLGKLRITGMTKNNLG